MNLRMGLVLVASILALSCSSTLQPLPDDRVEARLAAPIDQVKAALTQVLTEGGYEVDWNDDQHADHRLPRRNARPGTGSTAGRFGTIKSRVQASIAEETEQSTALNWKYSPKEKTGSLRAGKTSRAPFPECRQSIAATQKRPEATLILTSILSQRCPAHRPDRARTVPPFDTRSAGRSREFSPP